jgi:hypothetical protein
VIGYLTVAYLVIAAYLLGVVSCGIFILTLLAHKMRSRPEMPTMRRKREQPIRYPCRTCYGGDLPCVCKHWPKTREPDLADVGDAAERGVNYSFMGVAGEAEE